MIRADYINKNIPKSDVSIFIPCWGYGEYLKKAIDSALKQTVPCRVVVFDNNSTDCTKEVMSKYNTIIKLHSDIYIEWMALLNLLIRDYGGKYVVILGADDTIEPKFIEKSLEQMADNVGVVRTGYKAFGADKWTEAPDKELYLLQQEVNNCIPFTSLTRKKSWEDAGGYDESTPGYEDWEFWIRVMQKGWRVAGVREKLFNYNVHKDSGYFIAYDQDDKIKEYIDSKCRAWHKKNNTLDYYLAAKKMNADITHFKQLLKVKEQLLIEKDVLIAEKDKEISEKSHKLASIMNSRTWKYISIIKNTIRFFRGKR